MYILSNGDVSKWEERSTYKVLVEKSKWNRLSGEFMRNGEDDIKMDLKPVGWEGQVQLAQDRDKWWALVSTVMNLQVP